MSTENELQHFLTNIYISSNNATCNKTIGLFLNVYKAFVHYEVLTIFLFNKVLIMDQQLILYMVTLPGKQQIILYGYQSRTVLCLKNVLFIYLAEF